MAWIFEDEIEDPTRGMSPLSDTLRGGMPSPPMVRPMSPLGNFEGDLPEMGESEFESAKSKVSQSFLTDPINAIAMMGRGPLGVAYQTGAGAATEGIEGGNPLWGGAKGLGAGLVGQAVGKGIDVTRGAVAGMREPAERLVQFLQESVPPLKGMTDLGSMIAGKGKTLVQDMMQQSEDALIAKAGDRMIPLLVGDIKELGLKGTRSPNPGIDPANEQLVPADQLIKAIKGHGTAEERNMYERVLAILEAHGLKDPVAHAAYKNYMGIRDFLEETGALKGGRLDVGKIRAGLQDTKIQDKTIGWRGMGNAEEGPLARSVEGINPMNLTGPLGTAGAVAGGVLGHKTGIPFGHYGGATLGAGAGAGLGKLMGPLNVKQMEPVIPPQTIGELIRQLLSGY